MNDNLLTFLIWGIFDADVIETFLFLQKRNNADDRWRKTCRVFLFFYIALV